MGSKVEYLASNSRCRLLLRFAHLNRLRYASFRYTNTTDPKLNFSKVPEVTLLFWLMKIIATTLGETAGYAVTMSMNLGYLVGPAIFTTIFVLAVTA